MSKVVKHGAPSVTCGHPLAAVTRFFELSDLRAHLARQHTQTAALQLYHTVTLYMAPRHVLLHIGL